MLGILVLKGPAVTYQTVNTEMGTDRAKLLMHRLVARRISQQPELIETVKRTLSTGPRSLSSSQEWLEILDRTPEEVRKMITSRSSQMTRPPRLPALVPVAPPSVILRESFEESRRDARFTTRATTKFPARSAAVTVNGNHEGTSACTVTR